MNNAVIKFFFSLLFGTVALSNFLFAITPPKFQQESNPFSQMSDSTKAEIPADSLIQDSSLIVPDSTRLDQLRPQKTASVGMDTTLYYDAKIIKINVPEKLTYLIKDAEVKYKTMKLTAEKITVDWNTNILTAEGVPDTVYHPSNNPGDSNMSIEWKGLPTLADRGDVMHGFKMIYNFKTEKGRVIRGRTEYESGYYFGESMKKVGEDIINISHGQFTTCDNKEDPHFHFQSRRIKVIHKDKVIARPVALYLGNIPVAIIPFAVFPHKTGRHSGVVIPSYGESQAEGRFIRGLGYYWAPNDYFDARTLVDYYDRSGWMLRSDLNYAVRYLLKGSVRGSFTRKDFKTGQKQRRWDLLISHNQEIDPTMSLRIDGRLVSDNSFYRDYSSNLNERLNREIRSNATFSKNWSAQRMSLSANLSQVRDIETGRITQTFPQIRFTVSQRRFFEYEESRRTKSRGEEKKEMKWYHSIYYNYSNNLYNQETKGGDYKPTLTRYLDHNMSISMNSPQKIFGWLTMGQSISYRERWYDRYKKNEFDVETNAVQVDTARGFAALRTFSYSLSSSTNIYGLFNPHIWKIQSIRHVITPNISFSYTPDFSSPLWGYVDTFIDTTGEKIIRSKFMDSVPSGTQKSISFSVRNLFQMKTLEGEKEKKFDLFSITSSTAYNFEAEQFKLSPLSSSFRSTIIKNLNLNVSTTHDFYKTDGKTGRKLDQLLFLDDNDWWKRKLFRLSSFRLSTSISLQGSKKGGQRQFDEEDGVMMDEQGEMVSSDEYYDQLNIAGGERFEPETRFSGLDIPWRTSLSFDFDLNKMNPKKPTKSYNLNISGMEIQLTKNWKINYSARYDLTDKKLVSHSFTFHRNLHCWEARFIWSPSGIGAPYFYFRIQVKSTQLRDLKWEKRGGRSSVFGY